MQKLLLVVNPNSGMKRAQKKLLEISDVFCKAGFRTEIHTTQKKMDAAFFVSEHSKEFDVIVAVGGDGTLNEVITGAVKSEYNGIYGFIPSGTTNDLANSLGIPKEPQTAAKFIAQNKAKPLDIASFGPDRFFSYVASFGAFTETSYTTDQKFKNAIGHFAYIAEGVNSISQIKPRHLKVTLDGKKYEGDYIFGAVANALSVGGIMKLSEKEVDFADGLHEILLVEKPKNPIHFAQIFTGVMNGDFSTPGVIFDHGKDFLFEFEEEIDWCVDGEFAGTSKTAEIHNIHGKLNVVRP